MKPQLNRSYCTRYKNLNCKHKGSIKSFCKQQIQKGFPSAQLCLRQAALPTLLTQYLMKQLHGHLFPSPAELDLTVPSTRYLKLISLQCRGQAEGPDSPKSCTLQNCLPVPCRRGVHPPSSPTAAACLSIVCFPQPAWLSSILSSPGLYPEPQEGAGCTSPGTDISDFLGVSAS